ncbi:HAMP domain-containing sensor histidine kinase [Arcanobacterium hippocoleae]
MLSAALTGTLILARTLHRKTQHLTQELTEIEFRPAIISHEIRTPIALISGAAELLNEGLAGKLNPQQQTFVQTISENSAQVINIAENFLIDTKLEHPQKVQKEDIDLREIVTQTARELRRTTTVPISVDTVGGILEIKANAQLIRQLIWNLVNNCVRHAGENAQVNVRVANGENGGALITISDNGDGIDPAEYENIFKPFTTGTGRKPGTGIGMMVAKRIVEVHGGKILLDSLPAKGTAFHILLPRK